MANPQITTPPAPVITPGDVRDHVKFTETAEDGLLALFVAAGTEYVEQWLRRSFAQRSCLYRLDGFHDRARKLNVYDKTGEIFIPGPPLIAIQSIKYDDVDGNEQTLDAAEYQFDIYSEPGRLRPAPDSSWPTTEASAYNTVRIAYTAGYATLAAVPERYKQIVRWVAALWWRNREPVAPTALTDVPHTVTAFIDQFRVWRIG